MLDKWPLSVLKKADTSTEEALLETIVTTQTVFNGYDCHTAHDLLYRLHLWPGTPLSVVCADDALYARFKALLGTYAHQFIDADYRSSCLGTANNLSPFGFNYKSDNNYLNRFVKVYRKWQVKVTRTEYNELYMDGLLDPNHIIGPLYCQYS